MLVIQSFDHFTRVVTFAQSKGPQHEGWLWDRLWYLHTWADRGEMTPTSRPDVPRIAVWDLWIAENWGPLVQGKVTAKLMYDGAAASFYWIAVGANGETIMNGGLIYHGCQEGWRPDGQYTDPFSVELTRSAGENPWSVHT